MIFIFIRIAIHCVNRWTVIQARIPMVLGPKNIGQFTLLTDENISRLLLTIPGWAVDLD